MTNYRYLFILLLLLSLAPLVAIPEYNLDLPKGIERESLPCLIIAPGNGYHKDLPIITDLAAQITNAGYACLRFNWTPREKGLEDSLYNKIRQENVQQMIDFAMKNSRINPAAIFLAGKSLGSIFAYRAAQKNPEIKGIVLLTPIFPDDAYTDMLYPGLDKESRPILIVAGDKDPDNANLPVLYRVAGKCTPLINIVIVSGDHGLNVGDYNDPQMQERNMLNITNANRIVTFWMQEQLRHSGNK